MSRDHPPWYYRTIAPPFYGLSALSMAATAYFAVRWLGGRDVLFSVASFAGGTAVSYWFARWCNRHADELEQQSQDSRSGNAESKRKPGIIDGIGALFFL
jgi:hypothetical protein